MERILVLVRVRPVHDKEAVTSPWKFTGNTICLSNQGPKFEFEKVFGQESKTVDIYEARTKDIVAAAVRGFNGTVFAYGQTSSGKTHTMRGSATEPGVIPLAVHDVFKNIREAEDREFLIRVSYMEIYNEEINDLLVPEHRKLQVHESVERGIFVAGLREEIVGNPEQVLQLMEFGEWHRHIGETNMNAYSSRSHTIFRMVIESRDKNESDSVGMSCDAVRVSVLNLVDLAGSERVAKTGAEGARLKEGSHINKSLMALGTVIKKLSEGVETQRGHVPYRDSKLTRILQPALGGNAKTAIICNITPALIHVDETKGTLQFASRASHVTNCAQVNEIVTDTALLKRQKREIEELRSKLQESHSEHLEEEILSLRNTLLQSELQRERIALELHEEKKAQAERERQLQEQAQRIENLSTMVLYSVRDDRETCGKKKIRRETWCPDAPLKEFTEEVYNLPSKEPLRDIVPGRRDRDLPPPFEKLCENQELDTNNFSRQNVGAIGQGFPTEKVDVPSSWVEYTLPDASTSLHVTGRMGKLSIQNMTINELRNELLELHRLLQDLECEHENQRKMKDCEIEDLKKQLAKAEGIARQPKVIKIYHGQSTHRGGESLTAWESEGSMFNEQLEDKVNIDAILLLENYNNLKRTLAEAHSKIAALEDDLFVANKERETLASELEVVSMELKSTCLDLKSLREKHAALTEQLHEQETTCKQIKHSEIVMLKEKEKMATEEKAVSSAREKEVQEGVKEEEHRKLSIVESEVNVLKEYLQSVHRVDISASVSALMKYVLSFCCLFIIFLFFST